MSLSKLASLFPCFPCTSTSPSPTTYPDEKAALLTTHAAEQDTSRTASLIATDVVTTLLSTTLSGPALQMHLDSLVGPYGWRSNLAQWVLEKLSRALEYGHDDLGPAVRDAYEKALAAAMSVEGFVIEHPVFCTVVALGVLAVMAPWVLGALGFCEVGIEEGMC